MTSEPQKEPRTGEPADEGPLQNKRAPYPNHRSLEIFICLLLVLSTLVVYWQVQNSGFINFDDATYVTENPHVQRGLTLQAVIWAFTTTHAGNWHPLTWLSHMLDYEFWSLKPAGHHMANLFLHIVNTLLLFLVLQRMVRATWRNAFVAALFALHPLHVESVAWVAERKDVLCALFWILTMGAYTYYVKRPTLIRYAGVIVCFVLGLLSKPMIVTLPFVLLLLDYWPLGRKAEGVGATRLILEKTPLFVLTVVSCLITLYAQTEGGATGALEQLPFLNRTANALVSYVSYIAKMVWPQHLAILYPHPVSLPVWQVLGAAVLLIIVTLLAIRERTRHPYLLVGWLWYLGTLVPVIGFVQVGIQAVADRYTYIPLIGLFIIIAYGIPGSLARMRNGRIALALSGVLLLLILAILTRSQVQLWENEIRLYVFTLNVTSDNFVVQNNLGKAFASRGQNEKAISHFVEALRISPNNTLAHKNLGVVLVAQGKIEEAGFHFAKALGTNPDNAEVRHSIGVVLVGQGKPQEAAPYFESALRANPKRADSHNYLGVIYTNQGKNKEAIAHFTEALRIDPAYQEAHRNLGTALLREGRNEEAIRSFSEALRIDPRDEKAHNSLGVALGRQGKIPEAMTHYIQALEINPLSVDAHCNLGEILSLQGKTQEAIFHYTQALRIQPRDAEAHARLGVLLGQQGKYHEAVEHLSQALRIDPENARWHFALGLIYLGMGKKDFALKEYEILKAIHPELANTLQQKIKSP